MTKKFKKRYVLGIGQPVFESNRVRLFGCFLSSPEEFITFDTVPKYRLILERVTKKGE